MMTANEAREKTCTAWKSYLLNQINKRIDRGFFDLELAGSDLNSELWDKAISFLTELHYKVNIYNQRENIYGNIVYTGQTLRISWK